VEANYGMSLGKAFNFPNIVELLVIQPIKSENQELDLDQVGNIAAQIPPSPERSNSGTNNDSEEEKLSYQIPKLEDEHPTLEVDLSSSNNPCKEDDINCPEVPADIGGGKTPE